MTFDEAQQLLLNNVTDEEVRPLVVYVMSVLKDTYTPTVEMTSKGKKYFDSAKKYPDKQIFDSFAILDSDSRFEMQTMLGTDDVRCLTNGYQTMAGSFAKNSESVDEIMEKYTVPFMQAWLRPETIKVVDDD